MRTIDEIEKVIGPIPRGPIIGGEQLLDGPIESIVDPATEEMVAEIALAGVEDAVRAVDAAEQALPLWNELSPRQRSELLRRIFELMMRHQDALARIIVLENGKSYADASGEVAYAAEFFRWYAEEAVRLKGEFETAPSGNNRIMVMRQPIGVSLLITPWNFPAAMATRKIAPALAAGCSVVLKPANETPLTALAIGALIKEAGVPDGVVNIVTSRESNAVASRLLDDDRVRKVSFTGSTEVGRILLSHASRTVVSASMELGGNAPFLVLPGADIADAVSGAMVAKMRNGGSACTAANRFIVHSSLAEKFSAELAARMSDLQVGHGLDEGVGVGPLVNAKTRDKVSSLVESALDEGAVPVTGAQAPGRAGYFYEPTVLGSVPFDAAILGQEIFGPVAPVVSYDDLDEAIELANRTEYGLVSYAYGSDLAELLRVSERLDSGMIGLNRPVVSDPAAPFGGTKQSGLGREGGHEGMLEFTESKYIAVQW